MSQEDFKRKLTAILSADVVGYSRLMGEDEAATVKTLETYKGVMYSLIKQHRGRVIDSPGDNLLAEFGSVVDAVQCAVSIQKELQTRNAELPDNRKMEFRIGINLGDVIEEQDRIYGDGVNIAARLEALADPGGICISKTAFDYIENKLPFGYKFIGEQPVKNIAKPVGAYRVLMETRVVDEEEQKAKAHFWRKKSVLSIGIILILAIVAFLYWNFYLRESSIEQASVEKMAYPLPDKPSIAVLPFINMSGDPKQDYIGDGLSEIIRNALSVSSQMFVMDRNATIIYKGTPAKPQKVAEDLGVQYILDGSIHKSGNQLRVTAQLIDALNGHQLWSDVYDREMKNLFDLQDEITKKIIVSLQVEFSGSEDVRVYAKSTDNLEAWKHYIKGIELYGNLNAKDNLKAREHFEAALELDPVFIAALSSLAQTHIEDFIFEWGDSQITSMNRALELAKKAVEMDDQDPPAHAILGLVFLYKNELEKAATEGIKAITLNPNYGFGHVVLAYTMHHSGRFDEAITLSKKAYRLNPIFISLNLYVMATSYIFLERYEEALEILKQMEQHVLPGSRAEAMTKAAFSWVYQELGREEEARAYIAEALKIKPDYSLENFLNNPYKDPAHLQRELDALRKAGMPEHPPGAVQEKPSIAVLPFDDLSPNKDQEYFVDGLSEEILNSLTQIPNLRVIAKTSSFSFKGQNKTVQEIAKVLGVDHVLEGSVRKSGNAIRITAQLIKADDESHVWSETYDKDLGVKELFYIQEDIANNVANKFKLTLEAFQLLGGTENIDAYELYLNAMGKGAETDKVSDYKIVLQLLDKSISLDPEFAYAWTLKSLYHMLLQVYGPLSNAIREGNAGINAAQNAIELEPKLADAYVYLGLLYRLKHEWIKAELDINKAIELTNGSLSGEHQVLIVNYYLTVGKLKKAQDILEVVQENDPLNQLTGMMAYYTYCFLGDMQRVEAEYKNRGKFLEKGFSDIHDDTITHVRVGSGEKLKLDDIVYSNHINDIAKKYLSSPEKGLYELRQFYRNSENLSIRDLVYISIWSAYFGDFDFATEVSEKGGLVREVWFPIMEKARNTPQFKDWVREIGLVDYWKTYGWPDLCHPVGGNDFVCY